MRALVEPHESGVEMYLVRTPSLALKRPPYRFHHWCYKLPFYLLHDAAEGTGRGGWLLVCGRKMPDKAPAAS